MISTVMVCVLSRANGSNYNVGAYETREVAISAAEQFIQAMGGREWVRTRVEPPRWIHPLHGALFFEALHLQSAADLASGIGAHEGEHVIRHGVAV